MSDPWLTDTQFLACLPFTLKEEGGFSNDAHDPGGATMWGIIQSEYNAYRHKKGLPLQSVRAISRGEMDEIYYTSYWLPDCPLCPPGINLYLFDDNVNEGPHRGVELLQAALGVTIDGIIGPNTLTAIRAQSATPAGTRTLLEHFMLRREAFYRGLGTFRYFGSDWIGRSQRIEQAALAMIGDGK